jgi:hypothetical protein
MILQSLSTATIDLNRSASAKETTEISKSNFIFAPCMGQKAYFGIVLSKNSSNFLVLAFKSRIALSEQGVSHAKQALFLSGRESREKKQSELTGCCEQRAAVFTTDADK